MEVQSRCETCNNLVPDLVMEEHVSTCWAATDNKRVRFKKMSLYPVLCIGVWCLCNVFSFLPELDAVTL